MRNRSPAVLPPYPEGWYAIAFCHEVKRGAPITVNYLGARPTLTRNADGNLSATELPGRYDQLIEEHGAILHFFGHGPSWPLYPAADSHYGTPVCQRWSVQTHPQEVIENTVDMAHFGKVHGYDNIEVVHPICMDGPYLTAHFAVTRQAGLFGPLDPTSVPMQLNIKASGLGYSRVDIKIDKLGLALCQVVMPTPTYGGRVRFHATTQAAPLKLPSAIEKLVPTGLIANLIARIAAVGMRHDVHQDFPIWEHKRYVERPTLVKEDGPIGHYRKWASQFYSPFSLSGAAP